VTHVATGLASASDETVTSLEKMYEALPKRRKSAPVDPFDTVSEPKPKKWKDLDVQPLINSSVPLFDSYPYFLAGEDLEPTEQPLVLQEEKIDHDPKNRKGSRYPLLPKIPTQIRWDATKTPYVAECFPLSHLFRTLDSSNLESNLQHFHSFDDFQNQTKFFSRSKDWETNSILSDISEINGARSDCSSCEKERKTERVCNDLENVSSHANGGDLLVLKEMLSSGQSDDGSTSTDAQLLSQGSGERHACGNDREDGEYIWFEEVADLANSL
jgi:hypothetical protein